MRQQGRPHTAGAKLAEVQPTHRRQRHVVVDVAEGDRDRHKRQHHAPLVLRLHSVPCTHLHTQIAMSSMLLAVTLAVQVDTRAVVRVTCMQQDRRISGRYILDTWCVSLITCSDLGLECMLWQGFLQFERHLSSAALSGASLSNTCSNCNMLDTHLSCGRS